MLPGGVSALHHQPAHPPVPRPTHPTDPRLLTGLADAGSQPSPGGKPLIAAEPIDVPDLRLEEHRGEVSDAGHRHQQPHPGVIQGEGRNLLLHEPHLLINRLQYGEVGSEDGARRGSCTRGHKSL